jgi:hypothetical protein
MLRSSWAALFMPASWTPAAVIASCAVCQL